MSEHLNETAAEIAALIPKYQWEIMDEEQRDDLMVKIVAPRYMKTTADGVQTGPTFWAELVGASASAIRSREYRLRQSQMPSDEARAPGAVPPSRRRDAKTVLRRDPKVITEMVEELHDDPAFQAAVASASSQIDAKHEQRTSERERVERGLSEQEAEFERLRKDIRHGNYGEVERRLRNMQIDEELAAYLHKQAERHRQLADWLAAWADAKPIADEQLQEWLA